MKRMETESNNGKLTKIADNVLEMLLYKLF